MFGIKCYYYLFMEHVIASQQPYYCFWSCAGSDTTPCVLCAVDTFMFLFLQ